MKQNTKVFWVNLGLLALIASYTYVFLQPLTSGSLQTLTLNCSAYSHGYEDFCFFRRSDNRGNNDLEYSLSMCGKIRQEHLRNHCMTHLAHSTALGGDITSSSEICASMDAGAFKSDCFFRLAEESGRRDSDYNRAYELCKRSDDFEYDCIGHLEERVHEQGEGKALNFCKLVAAEYENISGVPAAYCYNHFGLKIGRKQASACEKVRACDVAGKYKNDCLRGVVAMTKSSESELDKC